MMSTRVRAKPGKCVSCNGVHKGISCDNVCKVQWFDGDVSLEFLKVLVVLSEGR